MNEVVDLLNEILDELKIMNNWMIFVEMNMMMVLWKIYMIN